MTAPHAAPTFEGLPRRGVGGSSTALVLWLLLLAGFAFAVAGPAGLARSGRQDLAAVPCPPTCQAPVARPAG